MQGPLITAFTKHAETRALLHGSLWYLLCALQPVNALVFVYDGYLSSPLLTSPHLSSPLLTSPHFSSPARSAQQRSRGRLNPTRPPSALDSHHHQSVLYAARAFRYVRNALCAGVTLIFAPALAVALVFAPRPHALLAIWGAKAALNAWRCLTALVYVHVISWPRWTATGTTSTGEEVGPASNAHHHYGVDPLNSARADSHANERDRENTDDFGEVN